MKTLRKTNRTLDFFVDWDKCIAHGDNFSNHNTDLSGLRLL
ncbi:type II restriction endonuclease [Helicobacter suis]